MLLSIDTSAGTSAAVHEGGETIALARFDDPFGHAENIGSAITSALHEANTSLQELTAIAVGIGPAPYTGLRVGIAAAKALAAPLAVKLYGVMVLDAIAYSRDGDRLLVTTDAKRGELFVAGYVAGKREFGPKVMQPEKVAEMTDFVRASDPADAEKVGAYASWAIGQGVDLSDTTAIYLRSPDVTPSSGKRVSG